MHYLEMWHIIELWHNQQHFHRSRSILGRRAGSLSLRSYRKALGVEPGGTLVVWLEGDRLILRRRQAVEDELWSLMEDVEGSLTEELLSERRREAESEARD